MPSEVFHVAVGLLLGLAILGDAFDKRALIAVLLATMLPDFDSFLSIWFPGAHRTYLHNVFVFTLPAVAFLVVRRTEWLATVKARWPDVERVFWTCIIAVAVAGIGLDALGSGVNLFFPAQDQFYHVTGNVMYSSQEGFRQTLLDVDRSRIGSTQEIYYGSGFDPKPGPDPKHIDRTFPIFENPLQLLLSITAFSIVGYRMRKLRCRK